MRTAYASVSTAAETSFVSPPPAPITDQGLAGFVAMMRAESRRLGVPLLEPGGSRTPTVFEARVGPLALACLARPFDHDPAAIAVLDEAQFRGRWVSIDVDAGGDATLAVSARSDADGNDLRSRRA